MSSPELPKEISSGKENEHSNLKLSDIRQIQIMEQEWSQRIYDLEAMDDRILAEIEELRSTMSLSQTSLIDYNIAIYETEKINKKYFEKTHREINSLIRKHKSKYYFRIRSIGNKKYRQFTIIVFSDIYNPDNVIKELEDFFGRSRSNRKSFEIEQIFNMNNPLVVVSMIIIAFIIAVLSLN